MTPSYSRQDLDEIFSRPGVSSPILREVSKMVKTKVILMTHGWQISARGARRDPRCRGRIRCPGGCAARLEGRAGDGRLVRQPAGDCVTHTLRWLYAMFKKER